MGWDLLYLAQGDRPVTEYTIDFQTRALWLKWGNSAWHICSGIGWLHQRWTRIWTAIIDEGALCPDLANLSALLCMPLETTLWVICSFPGPWGSSPCFSSPGSSLSGRVHWCLLHHPLHLPSSSMAVLYTPSNAFAVSWMLDAVPGGLGGLRAGVMVLGSRRAYRQFSIHWGLPPLAV